MRISDWSSDVCSSDLRIRDKTMLLPYLQKATEGRDFAAVHPVSALKRKGLEALVAALLALVPEQPPLYGEDEITDKSQRFIAGELVREQLMRQLGRSEAHTSELQSLLRISYAVFS